MSGSDDRELAEKLPVPLIPQPHGGALLAGGLPGHRGGGGRPSDAIRAQFRRILDEHGVEVVRSAIAGEMTYVLSGICPHCGQRGAGDDLETGMVTPLTPDQRLRAIELAAKVGLGGKTSEPTMTGVIVLGAESPMMEEARRRAQAHRQAEYGTIEHTPYVPPPGHQVVIIEEDLSRASPEPHEPPAVLPAKPMTLAQQIAARRRAEREEQQRRRREGR